MEINDQTLLARFASDGSDEAFAEIVRRHVAWMYSAAVRQVGDRRLAEEVTQMVFIHLAQRAGKISKEVVLAGWLHRDIRFTALDLLRSEGRRRRREEASALMNRTEGESDPGWERIRPLLDEALDHLGAEDRHALLLRFFQQRDFAQIGDALGASAEAARKRVDRALDRLRVQLERRGIESASAALATALSAHAVETVPAAWASNLVASAAMAASTAGSASGGAMGLASIGFMGKTIGVTALVTVLVGVAVSWNVQSRALTEARNENRRLRGLAASAVVTPEAVAGRTVGLADTARDRADLDRLRREAGALRERLEQRRAEAAVARAAVQATPETQRESAPLLRVRDIADAGTTTPEALLQSHMAAMMRGDTNRLSQLWAIEPGADMENVGRHLQNMGKEAEKGIDTVLAELPLEGIRVLEQQSATGGDVWLVHEYVLKTGEIAQKSRLLVRPSETGWKLVIGLDAQPVMEMLEVSR